MDNEFVKENIVIFGITLEGLILASVVKNSLNKVIFFDNDTKWWNKEVLDGIECIAPKKMEQSYSYVISVKTEINRNAINNQLLNLFVLSKDIFYIDYSEIKDLINSISDQDHIECLWTYYMHYHLDLSNPRTYNEKLQWLKLHDRNQLYTKMVDKYEVKKIVSDMIGEEYVIPLLGKWDCFEKIDFEKLPNEFVLKTTHDSGGVVVCKDKRTFDFDYARKVLNNHLNVDYYELYREWPYKDVERRIIAEEYVEDEMLGELVDYKFFVFNGEVKCLFIATDRQNDKCETKFDFFDREFNWLNIKNGHPNADIKPKRPNNLDLMIKLAEKMTKDIPHVRVDFYEANGKVYFGEMTFFHWSGLVPFEPPEWDYIMGDWIKLPKSNVTE